MRSLLRALACVFLLAAPALAFGQGTASVYPRGLDLARARRPHPRRRDDRARSHRRHRAERRAHGARQAQRARQGAGREDRASARQRRRRAGDRVRARRRASILRPVICAIRARSPFPSDVYRKTLEAAARSFKLAGFRDIVFLGDSGDYQKDNQAVARALNREWSASPVRAHAVGEYYRAATVEFARGAEAPRLQGRGDRRACRACRYVADACDRSRARAQRPTAANAPRASAAIRAAPARQLGAPAVDAIVAQSVAAIRAAAQVIETLSYRRSLREVRGRHPARAARARVPAWHRRIAQAPRQRRGHHGTRHAAGARRPRTCTARPRRPR